MKEMSSIFPKEWVHPVLWFGKSSKTHSYPEIFGCCLVCPYPPGIPLLVPGEILDEARVNWLIEQRCFWPEQISNFVRVLC